MKIEPNEDENGMPQMEVNDEKKNPKRGFNIFVMIKRFFTYFTVEPFLICYVVPSIISAITTQQFNIAKACRADLNFTEPFCDNMFDSDSSDNETKAALVDSQILVANMATWTSPIQNGIPVLLILFLGAWSDRTGNRKILMLIPLIGEIISSVGLLLATYNFSEWTILVTGLIECLPTALSGGFSVVLMASYSYIADVTSAETRTFRMGLAGIIVSLGVPLGTSLGGVLTEKCGYYAVYSIILGFYIVGALYVIIRVKNIRHTKSEGTLARRIIDFFHPRNVWETIFILFKTKGQLLQILLIIFAHIIIIGPVFGESAVSYLYFLKEFSMTISEYGYYSTYSIFMGIAGTTVAVTIFCKLLKLHDTFLGIIGAFCKTISALMLGLAPTKNWLYAGPALDFFGGLSAISIRSLGTKLVDQDDIGKFCSILGLVEGIAPVIYQPIYSKLYANTLETIPGAFYIVGSCMTVPAILIFIYLFIVHKKTEKDVVKNPDEKEKYAHENAVTVL